MKILGIDPGLAAVGYALLDVNDDDPTDVVLVEYDTFETPAHTAERLRLAQIRGWLTAYLSVRQPGAVAIERPYPMQKMAGNIVPVAASFGVILEAVAASLVGRVGEYTPPQVKAAAGLSRGQKKADVRKALSERFGAKLRGRDDGLDAIAVALAYVRTLEREAEYAADVRRGIGGMA